ncbi:MAG: GDSL-type esterase/lipase family protein [Prosthecobacter sp.]|nr:GDSL-type esterase/lipase family protein [Prosthecobacter sp.]
MKLPSSKLAFKLAFALTLTLAPLLPAQTTTQKAPSASKPAAPVILDPADQPAPKKDPVTGQIQAGFQRMHESFLKRGKEGPIGVLFIGDSITQGWSGSGKKVWEESFSQYQPANFGISGDRTQHVLWRIANGELDGIKPKVVVLMIGTNNSAYPTEDIIKGDLAIVAAIHQKLPDAKLLLLAIFPRGAEASNPARAKLKAVNEALAKLDDGKRTRHLDIGGKFLDASGNIPKDIMPDALHPNAKGYEIWAAAIKAPLAEMMK